MIFDLKGLNIIPIHWGHSRTFTITFDGWEKVEVSATDKTFNEVLKMANQSFKVFVKMYEETHAFTEPILRWSPDGVFTLKIGILEIEEYNKRINKNL